jgi:L-threonine-O-3-phosphate decarboxylase
MAEEAGIPCDEILDFSSNINPLGPPEGVRAAILRAVEAIGRYPDPFCKALCARLASHYGLGESCILAGNGASDLIYLLPRAMGFRRVLLLQPSYIDYRRAALAAGANLEEIGLFEIDSFAVPWPSVEDALDRVDAAFLGSPNNPTGRSLSRDTLLNLVRRFDNVLFIIDESFSEFTSPKESVLGVEIPNLAVIRSLTKFFAVPSLRLGFLHAAPSIIEKVREIQAPWSVNGLAQEAGLALFDDGARLASAPPYVRSLRDSLQAGIDSIELFKCFPAEANFILVKILRGGPASGTLRAGLLRKGIAVRDCSNFPFLDETFFRVAVRSQEDNRRLISALGEFAGEYARGGAPGAA